MRTRLDELMELRDRVDREIVAEQRRHRYRHVVPGRTAQPPPQATRPPSKVVKLWAVERGLVPAVVRARCPAWLYDAYAEAHAQPAADD